LHILKFSTTLFKITFDHGGHIYFTKMVNFDCFELQINLLVAVVFMKHSFKCNIYDDADLGGDRRDCRDSPF
jgi:hypothetical protein